MYAIPYIWLLVGGFLLQFLHSLVFCIKCDDNLVLLLFIKRFFMLLSVSDLNRQAPYGIPRFLPFILLRYVAFYLCIYDFLKQPFPSWIQT